MKEGNCRFYLNQILSFIWKFWFWVVNEMLSNGNFFSLFFSFFTLLFAGLLSSWLAIDRNSMRRPNRGQRKARCPNPITIKFLKKHNQIFMGLCRFDFLHSSKHLAYVAPILLHGLPQRISTSIPHIGTSFQLGVR